MIVCERKWQLRLNLLANRSPMTKARDEPDALALRVVARIRVAAAIGVAATGSFLPDVTGRRAWLFLAIGLLWVPWTGVVLLGADNPKSRIAVLGGPAGDLVVLFAVQLLAPGVATAALPGYVAVVAFGAYTAGRAFASWLAAGALVFTVSAQYLAPSSGLDSSAGALLAAVLVALVLLLDRTANVRRLEVARSNRLEGRSDAILANIADGVLVTDGASRAVQCNPALARVLGRPEEQLIGRHCSEVLGLRAGERALDCSQGCALLAGAGSGDSALDQEVWRTGFDGRRQPLLANAVSVAGADGSVEVVHSLRDITKVKQADEAKTLFLATASHELRTPLTVISGFAATLRGHPEPDAAMRDKALAAIERRSMELTKIIDRLLLSSRIEAGRVDLTLRATEIGPLLGERAEALAAATGRSVAVKADSTIPPVQADAQAIVTVIDHLLDNAIKYSPGGEPVEVDVQVTADEVRVRVTDAGIGMGAEEAARCFEKFWQAESTDVRRFGGTGIGLYIVHSLVEAMNGGIEVSSVPGAGTAFTVTLRRAGAAVPDEDHAPAKEPSVIREFMRQIGVPMRIEA
jgi:PAS domain S-box-containing protein